MRLQRHLNYAQKGNAALEVMMLLPIVLVILMLLIDMGYNGVRYRHAQAGLRLGAFAYIDGLSSGMNKNTALQKAQASVSQKLFPGESTPVKLGASAPVGPSGPLKLVYELTKSIFPKAIFRQKVDISVTREPIYSSVTLRGETTEFRAIAIPGSRILATNTFTFCEMKGKGNYGGIMKALNAMNFRGFSILSLFGFCDGCKDKCK